MDTSPQQLREFAGTDRFLVRRCLGAGGMGVVYEVFDRERDLRVALKTILHVNGSNLYRFKKEFRVLADVTHPNLVRLYELFSEGDQWFFTMELVEGTDFLQYVCPPISPPIEDPRGDLQPTTPYASISLESATDAVAESAPNRASSPLETTLPYLYRNGDSAENERAALGAARDRHSRTTQPYPADIDPTRASDSLFSDTADFVAVSSSLPPPQLNRLRVVLRQLAEALCYLHAVGKLHRDIKPSNVLVTKQGRIVLLDFGLSTEVTDRDELHSTTGGQIIGTAGYMSPEQAAGASLTSASDWYSVGVMLYRVLTGRLPHVGKSLEVLLAKQLEDPVPPKETVPETPDDLNSLCVDLLRREPTERPTGEEVLRRLGAEPMIEIPTSMGSLREHPFVGRAPHITALRDAYKEVRHGRTVAAFIHGRSGAGKSALVQRFLDELNERGEAVVLAGRCYEQESVAYKAMDTMIDSLSRYLHRLSRVETEGLLPRDISALARVFPVLKRVEAIAQAPQRAHAISDQQELRRRAFAALRELLARIGDRRPLVLHIDDLQWGDLDSAALLSELLLPPDSPVLLLLCCYRSEYVEASPCLRMLLQSSEKSSPLADRREVSVDALTFEESRDLALALLGGDDPPAQNHAATIARESGGSPYFIYELVQHSREGGEIAERSTPAEAISLDEVLWGRIQRLPDEARRLLEALAVAGQPLQQAHACHAAGLDAEGLSALTFLRSNHLVRGTGPGAQDDVETYHDRIRETVINHLSPETLSDWHARLAHELERSGQADAETLAVHFEFADEQGKSGHYYALAAAEAAEALAFERAVKLYRRALELGSGAGPECRALRIKLGDALANAGRGLEAARTYQEAAAEGSREEALEIQQRVAYHFLVSGHIDEGLAAYRDVLRHVGLQLPRTPRRALARMLINRLLLAIRGYAYRERDASQIEPEELRRVDIARSVALGLTNVDWIRGSSIQTKSLLIALRVGEPFRIALSLAWEAVPSACQGRRARKRTLRLLAMSKSLAERVGHPQALGLATLAEGLTEFLWGRFRSAVEVTDRAAAMLRERCTGVMWELDTARIIGAWSLVYSGQVGELTRRFPVLFKEARERGDRYVECTLGTFPATLLHLAAEQVEEARNQAREAIGLWSQQGFHIQHLTYVYSNIYIDLYRGDGPAAWREIEKVSRQLNDSQLLGIELVRIDVLHLSGRCAVEAASVAKDPAALLRQAERSARKLDREGVAWGIGLAHLIRAGAASVRGDSVAAIALLRQAETALDAAGMALFAASARRRLGVILGGDEGQALVEKADTWMRSQSILNPARMAASFAPGFDAR